MKVYRFPCGDGVTAEVAISTDNVTPENLDALCGYLRIAVKTLTKSEKRSRAGTPNGLPTGTNSENKEPSEGDRG